MKEVDEIQWALIQSIRGFKQNTITDGEGNLGQHTRALFVWFTYNSQDFSEVPFKTEEQEAVNQHSYSTQTSYCHVDFFKKKIIASWKKVPRILAAVRNKFDEDLRIHSLLTHELFSTVDLSSIFRNNQISQLAFLDIKASRKCKGKTK